ncbi:MAG: Holliday junction branch migration protein RuvA, partial [Elusimicrobia bacterium]|nr:Holliday junction branch migration protein RuvA [Elusimicrobiota bacterium]
LIDGDVRLLIEAFGLTRKTAERLVAGLKDKVGYVATRAEARGRGQTPGDAAMSQALDALASLGYKPAEARTALQSVSAELAGRRASVEELLRLALKRL